MRRSVGHREDRNPLARPAEELPDSSAMTTPEPAPLPTPLSAFWRDLPREGRMLLSIVVVDFVGTGLVLPFSVVYLKIGRAHV